MAYRNRAKYYRDWRKANPENCRRHSKAYWEKVKTDKERLAGCVYRQLKVQAAYVLQGLNVDGSSRKRECPPETYTWAEEILAGKTTHRYRRWLYLRSEKPE